MLLLAIFVIEKFHVCKMSIDNKSPFPYTGIPRSIAPEPVLAVPDW